MHISSKQKSKHVYYKQTCKHMLIHEISRNKNKFIFIVKKLGIYIQKQGGNIGSSEGLK